MSANRRLAAIMVADVVGYSRLMEADEAGTLAALKERRTNILDPVVRAHSGRIVKVMGDGVLVEFASAVNAVAAAIELQKKMAAANEGVIEDRHIRLRIGINLGDVIGEGSDIYGEGVNIAARLEPLAQQGGIVVSGAIYDQVRGKTEAAFQDIGDQALKNIERPVRAYQVHINDGVPIVRPTLPLPDKPSIAVLPFQNMSGDVEQEYFADGIVEEIITELSRLRWLFVIARNSSFTYKGRPTEVKQIGRELGVRYVLEGSVRKAGNKVRITGQLIDASTGAHLWADRFDGDLEDIFELQDRVTASVIGAISPHLQRAEIERALKKPTASLDAYDHYMRGLSCVYQWTREANNEALTHFYRAIELDPKFASAYGMATECYDHRLMNGWMIDRPREIAEIARLARQTAALGKDDAVALCAAGIAMAMDVDEFEHGAALIDRALLLNPNLATAWFRSGWIKVYFGEPEVAIERAARAMLLSPHDPYLYEMQTVTGLAHFFAGRYAEALSWAEVAVREQPNFAPALRVMAASSAMAGRQDRSEKAITRLLEIHPALRISNLKELFPIRRTEDLARWEEALRKAGLPE